MLGSCGNTHKIINGDVLFIAHKCKIYAFLKFLLRIGGNVFINLTSLEFS